MLQQIGPYITGNPAPVFYKGSGCEACQYSGYTGRIGLFEVLRMTPAIKATITSRVTDIDIRRVAEREGYRPLAVDGIQKALAGLTTLAEVFRVAPPDLQTAGDAVIQKSSFDPSDEDNLSMNELPAVANIRPRRILIADDSEIVIKVLSNILESENYHVICAADGLEAIEKAQRERPDLILTDLVMPRMNGIELVKALKSQLSTRYIPIIMLTARKGVDTEVEGMEAGADDYLTKPVNPKRLLARMARFLKRS